MKLGAEQKKVAVLCGLLAVAAVIFMINSGEETPSAPQAVRVPPAATGGANTRPATQPETRSPRAGRGGAEFRPSMRPRRGEEQADPMSIDPTLRLDVLARLQEVKIEGPRRSVFDFGQPPAPAPDPKIAKASKTPVPSPLVKPAKEEKAESEPPAEAAKPKAPPIPLKFYGYISRSNVPAKRAFFMDGEEIHVVAEGDLVKKRYKIVRIGVNSVVVEDTQFGQQQTLPLEEQPG